MRCRLANVVVFQVGWWIAVLGAGRGHSWVSSFAVSGLVALNIQLSANPPATARISGIVALLGTLLDSILSAAGILLFVDNPFAPWLCPPWLIALWCLFATTLNNSLQWVAGRDGLAVLVGGLFGPLSYSAAQALGAMTLGPSPLGALIVLAGLWGVLLPLFMRIAARLEGQG